MRMVRVYHDQGRFRTAEIECQQHIAQRRIAFGDDSLSTMNAICLLLQIFQSQGRHNESLKLASETYIRASTSLSPTDGPMIDLKIQIALAHNNVANMWKQKHYLSRVSVAYAAVDR